jgi:hypothetical protein
LCFIRLQFCEFLANNKRSNDGMRVPSWLLWSCATLVMAGTAAYQRMTGPTYPVGGSANVAGQQVRFKLPRSYDGPDDAEIRIPVASPSITGRMEFRRFRSNDSWSHSALNRDTDALVGHIPHQPVAGKVMYRILLADGDQAPVPLTSEPVVIRFRNAVPFYVYAPHILLMFLALLFASRAGLEDLVRGARTYRLTVYSVWALGIGGLILGPLMQKYAFNAFWTGWPLGHDLTDNKTVAALLLWVIAFWRLRKDPRKRGWALAAFLLTLIVYYIPHSVLGSEIDYTQAAQ